MAALFRVNETLKRVANDSRADAVVEAAILFPVIILIFAALVMLAVYLPTRAALQRATQYTATALAVEKSDTWLFFDENAMSYYWETDKKRLENVYVGLFTGVRSAASRGEQMVAAVEGQGISAKSGELSVSCYLLNQFVYKEVVVTASREYTTPVDLSLIGFPRNLTITATSTAVVQNGEEFIRNIDLATDFISFVVKKFKLTKVTDVISSNWQKVESFMGW